MDINTPEQSRKLSLKKETLRTLDEADLAALDSVVGGTRVGVSVEVGPIEVGVSVGTDAAAQ